MVSGLDYAFAAGAGLLAGGVNAIAGGGTLISFPALQAIGLTSIDANVTNIVALTPGYLAGSYAQRGDLSGQARTARLLGVAAGLGGLVGSVLLVTVTGSTFSAVVPYLILLACAALLAQGWLRTLLEARRATQARPLGDGHLERAGVFCCGVYGGFFGAGLGIMLLAVLGLFTNDALNRVNVLKQVLSLVISLLASAFLAFSGHVAWGLAGAVAVASVAGGFLGGRMVHLVNPVVLRVLVVLLGVAVAVHFWV
ncbi:MAG: sulfite exporter TauE/SafE family protein [Acidimicrobiales bacterium]